MLGEKKIYKIIYIFFLFFVIFIGEPGISDTDIWRFCVIILLLKQNYVHYGFDIFKILYIIFLLILQIFEISFFLCSGEINDIFDIL